jgi:fermentation-respiration switch protein FrsA (DUF1100 family)
MSEPATAPPSPPAPPPRRRRWRWYVRLAVLAVAIGYPLIVGCDSWFYHPDRKVYYRPQEFGLSAEDVHFTTADGVRLHGWFLPAQGTPRGLVVHFHGNAANITNHVVGAVWLPPAGYHVLLFDYRGYGQSEGRVTRAGTTLDGLAAVDYALTRPEYEPGRLFAYGQSLGGAVATVVAAQRPQVRALAIEATFDSYRGIAARHAEKLVFFRFLARPLARLLVSAGHDPGDVIGELSPRPVLVIAGGQDRICPPELGRALYERAREPRAWLLIDGADHYEAAELGGHELERQVIATFEQGAALPLPDAAAP